MPTAHSLRLASSRNASSSHRSSIEPLESRIAPAYTALSLLVAATFTGDGADDTLSFSVENGLLKHNRHTAGDAGFASDLDFNTLLPGEQTFAASLLATVLVNTGGGSDTVVLGGDGKASLLLATFTVAGAGANTDTLEINDTSSLLGATLDLLNLNITGAVNVLRTGDAFNLVRLRGGLGNDVINYTGIEAGAYLIETGEGDDIIIGGNNTAPATILGGPGNDSITGGSGDDTIHGEAGDDVLIGGAGIDTIFGGDGHDQITGGDGNDILHGQTGDDSFFWNPGDDSDVIEGGAGSDLLVFNGANAAENFALSSVDGKLRLTRDVGGVVMTIGTTENLELNLLGGADNVEVGNLAGTELLSAQFNLAALMGGGDGAADTINISATDFEDDVRINAPAAGTIAITGLSTAFSIVGHELANDRLNVFGLLGIDNIFASPSALAQLIIVTDGEISSASYQPAFNFAVPSSFDAGKNPAAIAAGKLFGNHTDIVVANPATNTITILANNGTGFLPAVQLPTKGKTPRSVALEDFNNDGRLDIAVSNFGSQNISVFLNNGNGGFAAAQLFAVGSAPGVLRAGDLNGDGRVDLAVLTTGTPGTPTAPGAPVSVGSAVKIMHGLGTGAFTGALKVNTGGLGSRDLALADVNGDGRLDLVTANTGSNNISVLTATPAFTFGAAQRLRVGLKPLALAVGDVNGDGKADLAATHAVSRFISLFQNTSTGGATSFGSQTKLVYTGRLATALAIQDVDQDGRADLVAANSATGTVSVLRNLGFNLFRTPVTFDLDNLPARKTAGLVLADFTGDGRVDFAAAHAGTSDITILARIISSAA